MGRISETVVPSLRDSFAVRFWSKVSKTDSCWIWMGAVSPSLTDQYGKVKLPKSNKTERSHRVAFFLHYGIDPGSEFVLHSCDNPRCCNPDHLSLGSHDENMQQMSMRGRAHSFDQRGEENRNSVLTEGDVLNILADIDAGKTNVAIAEDYGVTHQMVSRIRTGKSWSHLSQGGVKKLPLDRASRIATPSGVLGESDFPHRNAA